MAGFKFIENGNVYDFDDRFVPQAPFLGGGMFSFGYNGNGQLGQGDIVPRSSPVQVGSLTNWKQVASGYRHTVAIKTDGTLWSFGNNGHGQLGQGDIVPRSSPVQVGSLTNWKSVASGDYFTLALQNS